jgi:hypothetical protein
MKVPVLPTPALNKNSKTTNGFVSTRECQHRTHLCDANIDIQSLTYQLTNDKVIGVKTKNAKDSKLILKTFL